MVNEQDEAQRSARQVSAARAFDLPRPARGRERRRVKWAATLVVLVLAVIGVAGYEFAANAGHPQRAAAAPRPGARGASAPVTASGGSGGPAPVTGSGGSGGPALAGSASASPASAGTASPSSSASAGAPAAPPRVLTVAGVTAFGPQGAADGQNPQNAARALSGDAATPWLSDWYASPDFFDLPAGTGLLVDLGRSETVTSVQVSLNGHGATLELRAGAMPEPSWLPVVATASDAGGVVPLTPVTSVHVRYLLLWFTKLPPDGAGTYQASVYQITVKGQP